jgi:hypothetical protein
MIRTGKHDPPEVREYVGPRKTSNQPVLGPTPPQSFRGKSEQAI